MPSKPKCRFSKPDGTSCKASCLPASDYCYFHDPTLAEERAAARRKGGRERSKRPAILPIADADPVEMKSVSDVLKLLSTTATDVRRGAVDCKTANCLGYLASVGLRAIVGADFEERLEALEKQAQQRRQA